MAKLLEQLVHLVLVAAGSKPASTPARADAAAIAIQLEAGKTRLVHQINQLRGQAVNKLCPQLHRQVALDGLNSVNPSPDAVPGLDQSYPPSRLRQHPGGCQPGNPRANHYRFEGIGSIACHAHSLHLPCECLGARALRRHRMLERLNR